MTKLTAIHSGSFCLFYLFQAEINKGNNSRLGSAQCSQIRHAKQCHHRDSLTRRNPSSEVSSSFLSLILLKSKLSKLIKSFCSISTMPGPPVIVLLMARDSKHSVLAAALLYFSSPEKLALGMKTKPVNTIRTTERQKNTAHGKSVRGREPDTKTDDCRRGAVSCTTRRRGRDTELVLECMRGPGIQLALYNNT